MAATPVRCLLLGALAALLRATVGCAAPPQEHFPADAPGCKAPVPVRNTAGSAKDVSFTWSGSCVKGLVEGLGKSEKFRRGELVATYTGEFVHGELEGHGLSGVASQCVATAASLEKSATNATN
jgi:hypothetical protein